MEGKLFHQLARKAGLVRPIITRRATPLIYPTGIANKICPAMRSFNSQFNFVFDSEQFDHISASVTSLSVFCSVVEFVYRENVFRR